MTTTATKKYKIQFSTRLIGAIGILQRFEEIVEAENEEQAVLKLYEKYKDIQQLIVKEVSE